MNDATTEPGAQTINRGAGLVLIILVTLLVWYISADRLTPYTSQARVQGFVVGVAPKVAGLITEVSVGNNQQVEATELLTHHSSP